MALKTAGKRISSAAEDARSSVQPTAEAAMQKIGTALGDTKERVGPALEDAKEKIGPALEDAKEKIGPALEDAKERLAPMAEQALEEGRKQGRRAAKKSKEAAAKMGIVEEPKKGHKLRNLLIMLGLAGVAAVIYKKVTGKDTEPAWTAAGTDRPASAPVVGDESGTATAGPVDGSETAPTAPLASEETVESPVPTTPDSPLEKKDL